MLALLGFIALAIYSYVEIQDYEKYQVSELQEINQELDNDSSVGLVFGAAITPEGEPRSVLRERLETAHELYQAGLIDRVLVSGYNDTINNDYNEPQAMLEYLLEHGVDRDHISVDFFGDSTFMTCRNAKEEFNLDTAVLITQTSHMNRALYTCHHFGIQAYGYKADGIDSNWNDVHQTIREIFGNIKVVIESSIEKGL